MFIAECTSVGQVARIITTLLNFFDIFFTLRKATNFDGIYSHGGDKTNEKENRKNK
jgi:hypothetical protein